MATARQGAASNRATPLRDLLDGILVTKREPNRSEIDALPLIDGLTAGEERDVRERVAEYAAEIASAANAGENSEARALVREAVDELGEYIGEDEKENPGGCRTRWPGRGARTIESTRSEANAESGSTAPFIVLASLRPSAAGRVRGGRRCGLRPRSRPPR